jgi:adenylosuccinate lyase
MKAVRNGGGRENMHLAIKKHAVAVAENLRQGKSILNEFARCLAEDHRIPLSLKEIDAVLNDHANFAASAPEQAEKFAKSVEKWTIRFPEAKDILPKELL